MNFTAETELQKIEKDLIITRRRINVVMAGVVIALCIVFALTVREMVRPAPEGHANTQLIQVSR